MKPVLSELSKKLKFEYKITFTYFIIGVIWILFSDKLLDLLVTDDALLTKFQTYKGTFYVLVTTFFLYLLVKVHMHNLRKTEKKLNESEFRFSKLYENGPFGMVIADKNFLFKRANPEFCSMMGYSEPELTKITFKHLSHPDDLIKDLPNIIKLMNKEISVYKTEKRYIRKNGEIFWASLTVISNYDSDGQFLYNLGIVEEITDRKNAEEKINLLNERISTATKASQVGIWDWDVKNNILTWDDQMYAIYGIQKEDFTGAYEAWLNGLHPGDKNSSQLNTQLALQGKKDYFTEFRVIWPNGDIHIVMAKGDVFRNESGEPVRMIGINYDITEQKKAEEKIREKDQEFRKLSANVPGLIFQFTRRPNGSYFVPIASKGIQNIFGCSPEDVSDDFTAIGNVLYPDDAERVIRDIEYSAEHLTFFTCEFRVQIPGRDIQWIYSQSTPEKLPDGSVTWYGFNTDITHMKLAESALRESEEKFRFLLENIPLPIAFSNETGEIVFRNERFLQTIGYTETEVPTVKEWWVKAYPDETYRNKLMLDWERELSIAKENNFEINTGEFQITCKNGIVRTVLISGIIIKGNLLIAFVDITDRKNAEKEITKLNETLEQRVIERTSQLEQANREMEAFSYSVSHDLRAPLRHINGYVDLLNQRYKEILPEKAQHYLSTITDASKQMGALIDDLLQFSRSGRQELVKVKIDMNLLVNDVILKAKPDIKNRKINWILKDLPEIHGDYSMIKQVWINLIDNAIKYTRLTEIAEIIIESKEEKDKYVFCIRDNGVGFDMKYANKLFGVFQRLHSQTQFEGTGIGLANVQRIILKHHGIVWAEAEPDKGATFYFTLPKK